MKRGRYVVVRDYDFARPDVFILDNSTYDECCAFINHLVTDECELDKKNGHKTTVKEVEEGRHYLITTIAARPGGGELVMTVNIMMADSIYNYAEGFKI